MLIVEDKKITHFRKVGDTYYGLGGPIVINSTDLTDWGEIGNDLLIFR